MNIKPLILTYVSLLILLGFLFTPILPLKAQPANQKVAELTVKAGAYDRNNTPISASLEGINLGLKTEHELQLYKIADGKEEAVAS